MSLLPRLRFGAVGSPAPEPLTFARTPSPAIADRDLPDFAFRLLAALLDELWSDSTCSYTSIPELAEKVGRSQSTVKRVGFCDPRAALATFVMSVTVASRAIRGWWFCASACEGPSLDFSDTGQNCTHDRPGLHPRGFRIGWGCGFKVDPPIK